MTYISFYKQLDFRSVDCRPLLNFGFCFYLLFLILVSVRFPLFVAFPFLGALFLHCPITSTINNTKDQAFSAPFPIPHAR